MKKKLISLGIAVLLIIVGCIVYQQNTRLTPTVSTEAKVEVSKNATYWKVTVTPKENNVYLTTSISGSDSYAVYSKHAFPWELPAKRSLTLTYKKNKSGAIIYRPNGTKLKTSDSPIITIEFKDRNNKVILD